MHILLTGHRGYIGSHLLKRLQENHSVVGIDIQDDPIRQDLLTCDFNEQFDLIIHLAGKSGVRQSIDDPAGYWRQNVEVSKRLFARYPDTRILYASSSSAYEPDLNPYAASKYLIEENAERYVDTLGMRIHTVYDSKPRKGMFVQKILDKQLEYVTTSPSAPVICRLENCISSFSFSSRNCIIWFATTRLDLFPEPMLSRSSLTLL